MIDVWNNITPRDPKGEGGYEDVKFPKRDPGGTSACVEKLSIDSLLE